MSESTKSVSEKKPLGRKVKVVRPIDASGEGVIHLAVQTSRNRWTASDYGVSLFVAEMPCGLGVELRKDNGEVYHALLAMNPANDTCDCKGNTAHAHCKHVEGLRVLLSRGKLRIPSAVEAGSVPVEERIVNLDAIGQLPDEDAETFARLPADPWGAYELAAA